jgi:hypothetical protein
MSENGNIDITSILARSLAALTQRYANKTHTQATFPSRLICVRVSSYVRAERSLLTGEAGLVTIKLTVKSDGGRTTRLSKGAVVAIVTKMIRSTFDGELHGLASVRLCEDESVACFDIKQELGLKMINK